MSGALRAALDAGGLSARKALGQHFLLDLNLTGRIARLAKLTPGDFVLEIGPGPGGLTAALLAAGARVLAVETDPRFVAHLRDHFAGQALAVVEADALKVDEAALLQAAGAVGPAPIVANLPYNVGTPLLVKWLKAGAWRGPMVLMFQMEVCERIVARPGEPHYGRLAVLTAARAHARLAMSVPRQAFTPPPKVESGVVVIEDRPDRFEDLAGLEHVTAAAFGQRRKMLRASLRSLGDAEALLHVAGIDPTARPETVPPEGFFALTRAFRAATA
jgi:16S rRNA (adenine1518-N6/adenine1519-N6)-dimethyltransferase